MKDCLFCRIIAGEIPSAKVYEDDKVLAFHDIDKKAPVHVLIIPKKHVDSMAALEAADFETVAHIYRVAQKLADDLGLKDGYRIVTNTGKDGGQTVGHLHFHMLGGRAMSWPPG